MAHEEQALFVNGVCAVSICVIFSLQILTQTAQVLTVELHRIFCAAHALKLELNAPRCSETDRASPTSIFVFYDNMSVDVATQTFHYRFPTTDSPHPAASVHKRKHD
jgi:hypothetical protein